MEKRGKNHKAWRRRYLVLLENELLYYKRRRDTAMSTLFCRGIHMPKRVSSLRLDNYHDMIFWVRALTHNCTHTQLQFSRASNEKR